MKNLRKQIAILAISFVSFLGIQTANALEGLSVGLSYNQAVFMGTGTETSTSGAGTKRNIDAEETGVFEDSIGSAFIEFKAGIVAVGVEYFLEDVTTPENTNLQAASVTNTVKATFEDHTTLYAHVNMPFGTYLKLGYHMVDVLTQESLGTGSKYGDTDTTGISVGLGYQYTADNGVFIRAEVSASEYDDVNATSEVDTSKKVEVTEMYGAVGSIKVGKSF